MFVHQTETLLDPTNIMIPISSMAATGCDHHKKTARSVSLINSSFGWAMLKNKKAHLEVMKKVYQGQIKDFPLGPPTSRTNAFPGSQIITSFRTTLADLGGGAWDPFLSFYAYIFTEKRRIGGPRPPMGARPPTVNPGSATEQNAQ